MKFKPLQDRILVEVVPEKSAAGIELPPSAAEPQQRGQVVAVGDGTRFPNGELIPVRVTTGDVVLFEGGTKMKIEGRELVMLREGDVLGICANIHEDRMRLALKR